MDDEKKITKKDEIARKLFDLPLNSNLSSDEIRWIMSHIPDGNDKGTNAQTQAKRDLSGVKYDHTQNEFHKAFGLSWKRDIEHICEVLNNCAETVEKKNNGGFRKSEVAELAIDQLTEKETAFIIGLGISGFSNYMKDRAIAKGIGLDLSGKSDVGDMLKGLLDGRVRGGIIGPDGMSGGFSSLEELKSELEKLLKIMRRRRGEGEDNE